MHIGTQKKKKSKHGHTFNFTVTATCSHYSKINNKGKSLIPKPQCQPPSHQQRSVSYDFPVLLYVNTHRHKNYRVFFLALKPPSGQLVSVWKPFTGECPHPRLQTRSNVLTAWMDVLRNQAPVSTDPWSIHSKTAFINPLKMNILPYLLFHTCTAIAFR